MKFSEKYKQLQDEKSLEKTLVKTIYTSMALEDQKVDEDFISETTKEILAKRKEQKSK
ncbi:MAG: hypothetical protein ACPGLV_07005 [Bacteroidia bacterium]